MKKVINKLRQERDDNLARLDAFSNTDEEIRNRDRKISELENVIESLRRDFDNHGSTLRSEDVAETYKELHALKSENSDLIKTNKKLIEDLANAHKLNSSTINANGQSSAFVDTLQSQMNTLREENVQLKAQLRKSPEKSSREAELERENIYLHNLLKNMMTDDTLHRPNYFSNENKAIDYTSSVTLSPKYESPKKDYKDLSTFLSSVRPPILSITILEKRSNV
jgi:hypothetical protein